MKLITILCIGILSTSCSKNDPPLSIGDAEKYGFEKDEQQLFQMIEAVDGWSGTWEGEVVELYQYQDSSSVKLIHFETTTDAGNFSNWQDKCQFKNMYLISKGNKACIELLKVKKS